MQAQYYSKANKVYVFGQGSRYYEWNCTNDKFVERNAEIELGSMKSSTVREDGIYGLDEQKAIVHFDGREWKIAKNK